MRGLKSHGTYEVAVSKMVASFAYDAWIEISDFLKLKNIVDVASFAYDAWIEISIRSHDQAAFTSHRLRTMRGLKFSYRLSLVAK